MVHDFVLNRPTSNFFLCVLKNNQMKMMAVQDNRRTFAAQTNKTHISTSIEG